MRCCKSCPHREACSELCDEAEQVAGRDHVVLEELPVSDPIVVVYQERRTSKRIALDAIMDKFSPRERQVVTLFLRGFCRQDVCKLLDITYTNLRKIISRIHLKLSQSTLISRD